MRDGIYTHRGWQPLQETGGKPARKSPLLLVGVLCLGIILLGSVLSGFVRWKGGTHG